MKRNSPDNVSNLFTQRQFIQKKKKIELNDKSGKGGKYTVIHTHNKMAKANVKQYENRLNSFSCWSGIVQYEILYKHVF